MSKSVLFIIAQNNFGDSQLFKAQEFLANRGIIAKVAAKTNDIAIGRNGREVAPDLSLEEVNPDDFDGVIFIGGGGAVNYMNNPRAWKIVRDFFSQGKIVGAIQIAPVILANAGILMGKRVTADFEEGRELINKGSEYTGMDVEADNKVITCRDETAVDKFGEKLAWELGL